MSAGARSAVPHRAAVGEGLVVHALDDSHAALRDLRRRALRLHAPAAPLSPEVPWGGDHVLNPHLVPADAAAPPRDAAVLIALMADAAGEPCVLFTERAGHLSDHAGQIALPGGKIETGETPADAACREAEEEVALPREAVEPLGLAEPYCTRTGFLVVPVVAVLRRDAVLSPDPAEVAAAFTVPWTHVMDAANQREFDFERNGERRRMLELIYEDRRIWGVTAGILRLVHQRLYRA